MATRGVRRGGLGLNVLISGSSGLVGSALLPVLTREGHAAIRLVRVPPRPGQSAVYWNPAAGELDSVGLEGTDAVIHLAGESLLGRWSAEKKTRIRESRVRGTRILCEALARLVHPPQVLLSASAIGYYGDRGEEILQEDSPPGTSFLASVCREWEAAAAPAVQQGIRVVQLRSGIVLSPAGGALAKMLTPFRMGLGGIVGSGRQYMSWIALDDLIEVILHALRRDTLRGPVNAVSPTPVTNQEFTRTLGRVLSRPTILPMPAFAARLAFGEMAEELLLASTRVEPARLQASGYRFHYPELEGALRHLLRA